MARQPYSLFRLKKKLQEKDFDPKDIDLAIQRAKNLNYLCEKDYTFSRITSLMRRGCATYLIKKRLKIEDQIEVTSEEVEKVFKEHNITEESLIKEIIAKKKPAAFKNEIHKEKVKNKILRYLQNKGYNWDIVSFLVDEEFKVP
ncbi:MAG: regulatory protein RecX [Bdellovibrionota bacterium]|nr:regulatory protein RecX [Bdellovibrionota bacterium]